MATLRTGIVEVLLWLAAATGLLCVVLAVLAFSMNITLVLFRTGSMEPTISAGDVAVVQQIPATEVEVGDVLTVERPGQLPVTHRVTSVGPGEGPEERTITMQGDANETEDPYPYVISEARTTLFTVPRLAEPIHRMGDPYVLATVTAAAALLVGWAFWPRDPRPRGRARDEAPAHGVQVGEGPSPSPPRHTKQGQRAAVGHRTSNRGRSAAGAGPSAPLFIAAAAAGLGLAVSGPAPAWASEGVAAEDGLVTESIRGEHLVLTSEFPFAEAAHLAPGQAVAWDVGVDLDEPPEGDVALLPGLSATGQAPFEYSVHTCAQPWESAPGLVETSPETRAQECAAGHRLLTERLDLGSSGEVRRFAGIEASEPVWFRVVVTVSEDAESSLQGSESVVQLHVSAQGEELVVETPTPEAGNAGSAPDATSTEDGRPEESDGVLAQTGFSLLLLALTAAALIVAGLVVQRRRAESVTKPAGRSWRLPHDEQDAETEKEDSHDVQGP